MTISVATWNTEWRNPQSESGRRISAILRATESDIIVVTEGVRDLLPEDGYAADAGPDWGYSLESSRRKVIVWSRYPLTLDFIGTEGATRGRLAAATAETSAGPIRILGVCIPWRDAHVSTGRRDASPWSEHLDYLDRFKGLLAELDAGVPTVIAGDFNQRIPRGRQPIAVAARLHEVFTGWTIHTTGALPHGPHIDHVATSGQLVLESVSDWAASDPLGRLSDHAGVACRLRYRAPSPAGRAEDAGTELAPPVNRRAASTAFPQDVPANDSAPISTPQQPGGSLAPALPAEIADARGVGVSAARVYLRSLDALLTGTLPTSKSLALDNAYAHRELLNPPCRKGL